MPQTIQCTTTFLDGRERFEAGETRVVDAERAERFIAAGWATAAGAPDATASSPQQPASLEIHNSVIGQVARHG